jgi:hypothetical protein
LVNNVTDSNKHKDRVEGGVAGGTSADELYACQFEDAIIAVAERLSEVEKNAASKRKKKSVAVRKRAAFETIHPDITIAMLASVGAEDAIRLCIDLSFSVPFAPYDLSYSDKTFEKAVVDVVVKRWKITPAAVAAIFDDKRKITKAYNHLDVRKIVFMGGAGMTLLAVTGFAAAPLIAGAIGSAAGLTGAASTAYGLALLGGGSLAAGGAGMSGGLWLVTGVGAAAGAMGGGSAALLRSMGANELKIELAKLQVSFRQVEAAKLSHIAKAQQIIARLIEQREELERALAEERLLNDTNSKRIKELKRQPFRP